MANHKIASTVSDCHRVIPEKANRMARATLRKTESEDSWLEIGACLDFARRYVGWTIDELAAQLPPPKGSEKRDPGQVQRWIQGKEQTQIAVVFSVLALQQPFVIALARLSECFEEEITLKARKRA